jgi:LysM repeat protein
MSLGRKVSLLMLLLLSLSGCYRPASDALEPVTNPTAVPTVLDTGSEPNTDLTTATPEFPATATFPPVTVIRPTSLATATTQPSNDLVIETATEVAPATDVLASDIPVNSPSVTPQFITPDVPIGPISFDSPTPRALVPATPSGLITPTALFSGSQPCTYTIQPGDNLFRIALNHNTTLDELKAANPEVGDVIQPGQTLQIPNCVSSTATPATTVNATPVAPSGQQTTHTVAAGETLVAIAQRYSVTVAAIVAANSLANPDRLSVGQQLIIPPAQQ